MGSRRRLIDALHAPGEVEARLRALYLSATPDQRSAGADWYPQAQSIARELADWGPHHWHIVAGIIAALSPQSRWERNIELAERVVFDRPYTTTQDRYRKVRAMLDGVEPEFVLHGPKERAFYGSILDPDGHPYACIDRHMVRAAYGVVHEDEIRRYLDLVGAVERAQCAISRLAVEFGVSVPTFQATVWIVVRGSA